MPEGNITNIGIIAHVDAGKTTLTEQMLFKSGATLRAGSVDDGTAQTDYMEVERRRGISVKAATTYIQWQGREINLIDTPGHIDFAAEVERSLRVLDAAVLCLSAVEGVQAQSEQYYFALRKLGIPVLLFINKTDRMGADVGKVRHQIRQILGSETVPFLEKDAWLALLAERDDALADAWLENRPVAEAALLPVLARQTRCGDIIPFVAGSALKGEGIEPLLDMICTLAPLAGGDLQGPVAGIVFKVEHDKRLGRIAYIRLYSGILKNRDIVSNNNRGSFGKIVQIRKASGRKAVDIGILKAGDIAAVCGLTDVVAGDAIGEESQLPLALSVVQPLLRVRLRPEGEQDYTRLAAACAELTAEDPKLKMIWEPGVRQMLLHVTGTIQIEILEALFRERFDMNVALENPQVIYKETPIRPASGFDAYTMPKPCWAVVTFAIEPLPLGQGVVYTSAVSDNKIRDRYQGQIEQTVPRALEQGPRGWEVTDVKIALVDGEDHPVHTHPLDFATVTPMALMKGLVAAGTRLLEPVLRFRLTVPLPSAGKMISQIVNMRGSLDSGSLPDSPEEDRIGQDLLRRTLTGRVPVATSLDFPVYVAQVTSGRGILTMAFDGYEPCPEGLGENTEYRGVNPLERERYILHVRGAMQ